MPWEIGRLTDRQIEWIIAAQLKRQEAVEGKGPAPEPGNDLPTEDEYVRDSLSMFGGTAEQWRAEYRRCMEADRAKQQPA